MADTLTCRTCGHSWVQHGNMSGHCAGCHRTFYGENAFDRHLVHDRADGRPSHADPACVPAGKTGERFWCDHEGQWHYGQPVTPEDYAARQDARKTRIRNARRRTA